MSAQSTNYWLGGYWTAGKADGLIWHRGRWLDGNWIKGQWFSYTLELEWQVANVYKNDWSIWSGGTWKSNSQNNYTFRDYKVDTEYSIWHGGKWQSLPFENATYTWQGANVNALNIYGDINTFAADTLSPTQRNITLPAARSLFLGGQWLRGVWEGGIFSNSIWHSVPFARIGYEILDDLFYLYQNSEYPVFFDTDPKYAEINGEYSILAIDGIGITQETLDAQFLYNEDEIFNIDYSNENDYDELLSEFHSGAFVNSVWEGGRVLDTSEDAYSTMFGMSLSTNRSIVFDDAGIQNENGFFESNILLEQQLYGLNLPDWEQYYTNSTTESSVQQMINIYDTVDESNTPVEAYFIPNDLSSVGLYSVIWKRGKFLQGTFNYGQFFNYTAINEKIIDYISDLNINNTYNTYNSVFKKGLMYKSLFYGGLFMAQYTDDIPKSVFSRSIWLSGYWAAAAEALVGVLPRSTFTDSRYVTNAKFWKSIWMNGIWEGGHMVMSAWNCLNPFTYTITINNEVFQPSAIGSTIFENINLNPLGKITDFDYYDDNGNLLQLFQNVIDDLNKTDLLNPISADVSVLTNVDLVQNDNNYFILYYADDETGYASSNPTNCTNAPYDFVLSNECGTNGLGTDDSEDQQGIFNCTLVCNINDNNILICPNDGNSPIQNEDYFCFMDYGLVLINDTESTINSDIENENIFRTLGQVYNLLSVWQNGTFEGGIWNGGLWIKGEMESYNFDNYPTNIIDTSGNAAIFDYFDDNVINNVSQHFDAALWTRGIWYAGYMHAGSYYTAVPAYITQSSGNQILNLDITTKTCLTDSAYGSMYNSLSSSLLQLKSFNLVSINTRKSIRLVENSNFFFNVMNGQMLAGYFLDRAKIDTNTTIVPLIGTVLPTEFPNDLDSNGISKLNFGKWVVKQVGNNPLALETQIKDTAAGYLIKNTSNSILISTAVAEPFLYDPTTLQYNENVETGINGAGNSLTTKFYYEYLGSTELPSNRTELKHAISNATGQRSWSDLRDLNIDINLIVPSFAQGSANIAKPEPFELP